MFKSLTRKLADYIPAEYHGPLCEAAQYTKGMTKEAARALLFQEIELFPETFQRTLDQKLSDVGRTVVTPVPVSYTHLDVYKRQQYYKRNFVFLQQHRAVREFCILPLTDDNSF